MPGIEGDRAAGLLGPVGEQRGDAPLLPLLEREQKRREVVRHQMLVGEQLIDVIDGRRAGQLLQLGSERF